MDRIYNRAEDKNCANIIVYSKSSDTKAYSDKERTVQYKTSELKNAFMKGCIIVTDNTDNDEMLMPVEFLVNDSTNTGHLVYLGPGSTEDSITFKKLDSVSDDGTKPPKE